MKGIHIHNTHKDRTRYEKIESMPIPNEVTLLCSQHIGAPAKIIVSKKEEVKKGQLVAANFGSCSANIHTPIGGIVKDIIKVSAGASRLTEAVVIAKGEDQEEIRLSPLSDLKPEAIRERVKEAGIVGMGGAGFPAHIKLDPPKKIDIAFLNACECEPYLTADERLICEEAEKVIKGFKLAVSCVGADKGIITIEDDKPEAINKLKTVIKSDPLLELKVLEKIYPQGYEKMLVNESSSRKVPAGGLPHDIAVSVHNVGTCYAICEAVFEGKVLTDRIVTVSGSALVDPANIRAYIGQNISEILSYYQLENAERLLLLSGGPMMGLPLDSADMPVLKTTSGILINEFKEQKEYPCLKCGKCVEVCPMNLVPQELNKIAPFASYEQLEENGLVNCMECGCCTYICPSKIPLTYNFKTAKATKL